MTSASASSPDAAALLARAGTRSMAADVRGWRSTPEARISMQDANLDALIDLAEPMLGIAVEPAWRDAIRTHLRISLGHALAVAAVPLDDALDPAPVFSA